MKRKIVLATLTAISVSYAKDLTLQEAIETGLKNNYEVKATENLLKSKEYQYESAKGMRLPSLTFSEMFMRTNEPGFAMWNTMSQKKLDFMTSSKFVDMTAINPMFGGMFSKPSYPEVNAWKTKLELQLPIYTGGKLSSGIDMQKKDYEATKKDLVRAKEKAIYDISKAYYGALLAKEAIDLANQAYKDAEKHYNTAVSMVKNGLAIPADELRAKVYLSDMKSKIKEAENNYLVAKRGLLLAMGLDKVDSSEIDVVGHLQCEAINGSVEIIKIMHYLIGQTLLLSEKKLKLQKR
jgi:outer membrane protein